MWALCLGAALNLFAADPGQSTPSHAQIEAAAAARAKKSYADLRSRYRADTNNAEVVWQFSRACFEVALIESNKTERARIAEEGIGVSRRLVARQPDLVQAHFYLAMNIGQLADTKRGWSGLGMVKEMEREFEAAHRLDEHFDYAGPDRNLGLLYFETPSFISIGDRTKARQHLRRAIELAPDFPANRLHLIEADLKWGDRNEAVREVKALDELWPAASKKLTGDEWAADWVDWERRLEAAKRKLGLLPKAADAPRRY